MSVLPTYLLQLLLMQRLQKLKYNIWYYLSDRIPEFDRLAKSSFEVRVKELKTNLVTKSDITSALDVGDKTKNILDKIKMFKSSCFLVKCHLHADRTQK